jgi:hypothetical protein
MGDRLSLCTFNFHSHPRKLELMLWLVLPAFFPQGSLRITFSMCIPWPNLSTTSFKQPYLFLNRMSTIINLSIVILILLTIISDKTFFTFGDFGNGITKSSSEHLLRMRLLFDLIVVVHCENKQSN